MAIPSGQRHEASRDWVIVPAEKAETLIEKEIRASFYACHISGTLGQEQRESRSDQSDKFSMSASPFAEFQATAGPANQNDDKMGQIRELLLGEYRRQCDARLALLEARLRETELSLQRRLDEMQLRIEQLSDASEANQRAAFEELARGIAELSERVRPVR
jgi:hypothetical protein